MGTHNDSRPSFIIYEDNTFHCFGCSAHGSGAIDYVMQVSKCSFSEALEYLKRYE